MEQRMEQGMESFAVRSEGRRHLLPVSAATLGAAVATVALLAACDPPPVGPAAAGAGPFHLELSVDPDSFPAGGESTATIRVMNTLDRDTTVTATMGCLAFLATRKGDEPLALEGTAFACPAVITDFDVPAGDTLVVQHRIEAVLAEDPGRPAPPGRYVLEADFNVAEFPTLRTEFEIVE